MRRAAYVVVIIALGSLAACTTGPGPTAAPATEQPIRVTLVEVVTTETFPLELVVHVQGEPPGSGCWTYPASPARQVSGEVITLTVTSRLQPTGCTATPWRYDESVNLGSNFPTGDYTLWVNGVKQGFHFDTGFGP